MPSVPDDPSALLIPADNYALKPIYKAYKNFGEAMAPLLMQYPEDTLFDATVFYSRRKGITKDQHESLQHHNSQAFEAAKQVRGLLIYYQGSLLVDPDPKLIDPKLNLKFTPDCMSFCIWESAEYSHQGSMIAEHMAAVAKVKLWYEGFTIKKYKISYQKKTVNHKKIVEVKIEEFERKPFKPTDLETDSRLPAQHSHHL